MKSVYKDITVRGNMLTEKSSKKNINDDVKMEQVLSCYSSILSLNCRQETNEDLEKLSVDKKADKKK